MTTNQRRDLTDRLGREAERRGLRLERREPSRGKWVWDVRDAARGTLAVRGVSIEQVAAYLGGEDR
jgi:hypothetical protein